MSVVLFSGGCDSTHVLYNLAMKKLSKADSGTSYEPITALSITHDQVPAKEKQKLARQKIREEFKKRELEHYIDYIEITISQSQGQGIRVDDGLSQPMIWLPTAVLYSRSTDKIFLGYHKGDDYWMLKHEAETAMKNFLLIMGKKEVTLEYPLQQMIKADIIRDLKDRGLYDLCWYCEREVKIDEPPCGTCYPCKVHKTALLQIENKLDKPYGDNDYMIARTEVCKKDTIVTDKEVTESINNLVGACKDLSGS